MVSRILEQSFQIILDKNSRQNRANQKNPTNLKSDVFAPTDVCSRPSAGCGSFVYEIFWVKLSNGIDKLLYGKLIAPRSSSRCEINFLVNVFKWMLIMLIH